MKTIKIKKWTEIPENFTGIVEYPSGPKAWFKEGKFHRKDGPACEYSNGSKNWYLENKAYKLINLKNYVVLDYSEGEYGLMWYKLLNEEEIFEYPDIPGLITK